MKIKEITVKYGKTFNLGNYESERLECGLVVDIEAGDNVNDVYESALDFVKKRVHRIEEEGQ